MPSITDSIGRVLGDRYRLVTALGTGASAHVYLADDVSLHRRVAIKVLHPALAGDTAFLKRFRAEAQAVAALNHPNILQVYDWGEEDGVPYLVLEYLAGGSLRQVYDTGVLLTPEQAVQIGIEAAAGLDYAHRRGFVHRDIKPANLLFDADRRLRIADFGLARALAEAAWTEPDGAMLGTARYSAPEQVEGWVLDGKADVYALALVLYEGVTGETPFIGDTMLATLMARVGVLLPEHEALGPLNDVLVWAAAPEPAERYDASQLAERLEALARSLPRPAPLPIAEGATAGDVDEAAATRNGATRVRTGGLDGLDRTELGASGAAAEPRKGTRHLPTAKGKVGTAGRRRRRWPWIAAAAVLVAALIAGAVVVAARSELFTPSHPVPPLVGKSLAQADRAVRSTTSPCTHRPRLQHPSRPRPDPEPAPGPGFEAQAGHRQAGLDHRRGRLAGPAAGGHPRPLPDPHLQPGRPGPQGRASGGVCPPTAAQYSSVVRRRRHRHVAVREGRLRLDGDHHHLQGPRPGRRPGRHRQLLHLRHGLGRPRRARVRAQ